MCRATRTHRPRQRVWRPCRTRVRGPRLRAAGDPPRRGGERSSFFAGSRRRSRAYGYDVDHTVAAIGSLFSDPRRHPMDRQIATETVGDIVAADFRTAAIFERFGIDFCCGGRRSLSDACRTAAADPDEVIRALAEMP